MSSALAKLHGLIPGLSSDACLAWKPKRQREDHPFKHDPGDCRTCWGLCSNRRRAGTAFCDECWHMLSVHPSEKMRDAVLDRDDIPVEYIRAMVEDMDIAVSMKAEMRLEKLDEDDENADDIFTAPTIPKTGRRRRQ